MGIGRTFAIAAGISLLGACGAERPAATTATPTSGVMGLVHLGPQCPVETPDNPCEDQPAANATVTVSKQAPGEAYAAGKVVTRGTTDAEGTFRITVAPGEYVVTAAAGMSCELMDARVTAGTFIKVDVPCDTGIR